MNPESMNLMRCARGRGRRLEGHVSKVPHTRVQQVLLFSVGVKNNFVFLSRVQVANVSTSTAPNRVLTNNCGQDECVTSCMKRRSGYVTGVGRRGSIPA